MTFSEMLATGILLGFWALIGMTACTELAHSAELRRDQAASLYAVAYGHVGHLPARAPAVHMIPRQALCQRVLRHRRGADPSRRRHPRAGHGRALPHLFVGDPMDGYKTLIAACVGLAAQILAQYDIHIADEAGLTTSLVTILAFVGVIWGRLKAHRPGPLAPKE